MPLPLLATKLFAPPVRKQMAPRPRLAGRLQAGLDGRLTLVAAPAGYGKTTLVSAWLPDAGRPSAWLCLDAGDNDPARFSAYLLATLQKIDSELGQAAQAMLRTAQPPPPEALLTGLINDIAATTAPFILVLDDYHLITAPAIHQILAFLLEHQPPQMHMVILTREDPPLPLACLRAMGQVTDIRQRDLIFTTSEAADLLQRVQLVLPPADVATLQQRTEGWAAGLQLAALSMQGGADIRQFVAAFAGSHRFILDYLVEEVLRRQSPAVQLFLLQTSILDHLSGPLCDAVTGQDDGRAVLWALDQANLFLVPLDESGQWYRYHVLFRDLLRTQQDGLDAAVRHRRAAGWLERHGSLDEAMDHLLAARDWDESERLMEPAAAQAMNDGQFSTLNRWLDALPQERLRTSVELAAIKGWSLLALGQFAEAETWAGVAGSLLPPGARPISEALVLCLQTYIAQLRSDAAGVIALAERALALLAGSDPYGLAGAALSNLATAQITTGDIAAATTTLRRLAGLGREHGHAISAASALSTLAMLEHRRGNAATPLIYALRPWTCAWMDAAGRCRRQDMPTSCSA